MCIFAVSFDKRLWEESQREFQEQLLSKRIHDTAVCLKLLPTDEPLPKGIQIEAYQNAATISFCVEFPTAKGQADCDQFIFRGEYTA